MPDDDVHESLPHTEPHHTPIFDTGPHPEPLGSSTPTRVANVPQAARTDPSAVETSRSAPPPAPVRPISVPGQYRSLKRWTFVLMVLGVWIVAAAIGLGLYYWWVHDHSPHKTLPVFVVLIYVVVTTVGGLMTAMVQDKPLVSASAIAVMSSPFASVAAAAPLYGHYYCAHASRCLLGILPF